MNNFEKNCMLYMSKYGNTEFVNKLVNTVVCNGNIIVIYILSHGTSLFVYSTGIPQYTSNRFMSFRLYEMHKLIPIFQFMSQFSLIRAPSFHKPIIVPGTSSREVMGN
jgi:hypothetical protein